MSTTSGADPQQQTTETEPVVEPGDTTPETDGPVIAPPGTTQGSYSVCGRCYSVVANLDLHHEAVHQTDTTTAEEAT